MMRGAAFVGALCLLLCWSLPVLAHGEGGNSGGGPGGVTVLVIDWGQWGYIPGLNVGPGVTSGPQSVADNLRYSWNWEGGRVWYGPKSYLTTQFGGLRLPPVQFEEPGFGFRPRLSFDTSFHGRDALRFRIKNPWGPDDEDFFDDEDDWLPPRVDACQAPDWWIVGGGDPAGFTDPDWGTIAPRVSFAYDVTGDGSTVVRGGAGIFYHRPDTTTPADHILDSLEQRTRWGSFADQNGQFYDAQGFTLGGPLIKDKLWFFSWQCCRPNGEQPRYSLGKVGTSFSLGLEYNFGHWLEDAAADPAVNPFLAVSERIAEQGDRVFIPNKISF